MEGTTEETSLGTWQILASVLVAVCLAALMILLVRLTVFRRRSALKLPPGPPRYPLLGSLLSLGFGTAKLHETLHKLAKTHGPIMLIYLGAKPTLVISSPEMGEAVLKTHDQTLASRPDVFGFDKIFLTPIAFAPLGPEWRYFRKLCTAEVVSAPRLHQFKASRERAILEMLQAMMKTTQQGGSVKMRKFLSRLSFDNMALMILGESFYTWNSKGEPAFPEPTSLQVAIDEIFGATETMNVTHYMSILKPLVLLGAKTWEKTGHDKVDEILETILAQKIREQSSKSKEETSDEVVSNLDMLLSRCQESGAEKYLTIESAKSFVKEMIIAGSDTVPTMLEWIFLELLRNPSTLTKAKEELDSVVGRNRLVSESDIPRLKYIQAIVKEALRLHPAGPLGAPRQGKQDCEIAGYHVPAGTQIFVNLWGIHRNPQFWERPLEFDPDRFLNSSTSVDFKGLSFQFLPFGGGRRMCPGMNFGVLQMEFTLAQMLHAADWELADGQKPDQMDLSEADFSFFAALKSAVCLSVLVNPRLPAHVISLQA